MLLFGLQIVPLLFVADGFVVVVVVIVLLCFVLFLFEG